jgi:hypothetical protein
MAKKTNKPYTVPLDPQLAYEILNIPMDVEERPPQRTIGERVREATEAVEQANEFLAQSMMATIVARTLMRQLKKRGEAAIRVHPDGTVVLQVSYEKVAPAPRPPVKTATRKSRLPFMPELRSRAQAAGIDISDLGVKRKAIFKRIQAAEEALQQPEASLPPEPDEVLPEPPEQPTEVEVLPEVKPKPRRKKKPKPQEPEPEPPRTILRKKKRSEEVEDMDVEALLGDLAR